MNKNPLLGLETFGQSVWLDFLRRNALDNGEIQGLIDQDGVSGLTSNPSIFEKAIAGSHDYDNAIRSMALEGKSIEEIYEALTIEDIQHAADLFRPIYDRLEGGDGFVSLEVSPKLAHDTAGHDCRSPSSLDCGEPAQPVDQSPGNPRGIAGHPAIDRGRDQCQCYAPLRIAALPGGGGSLPGRVGNPGSSWQTPEPDCFGGEFLPEPDRCIDRPDAGETTAGRRTCRGDRGWPARTGRNCQRESSLPDLPGNLWQ